MSRGFTAASRTLDIVLSVCRNAHCGHGKSGALIIPLSARVTAMAK